MLFRYAQFMDYDMRSSILRGFVDIGEVSSWALDAMSWAVHHNIIRGVNGNRLNPLGTATRAECAVMLFRIYETFSS